MAYVTGETKPLFGVRLRQHHRLNKIRRIRGQKKEWYVTLRSLRQTAVKRTPESS